MEIFLHMRPFRIIYDYSLIHGKIIKCISEANGVCDVVLS
jgi:hypothetical protein